MAAPQVAKRCKSKWMQVNNGTKSIKHTKRQTDIKKEGR